MSQTIVKKTVRVRTDLGLSIIFAIALAAFNIVNFSIQKVEAVVTSDYSVENKYLSQKGESELTTRLMGQIGKYQISNPSEQNKLVADIESTASQRARYLKRLVRQRSDSIFDEVLPKSVLQQLPVPLKELLESEISIKGTLHYIHGDNFEAGRSLESYIIETEDGKSISVLLPDHLRTIQTPTQVNLSGVQIDTMIVGQTMEVGSVAVTEPISGQAQNGNKVGIVLFNFQNDQSQPITAVTALQRMFTDSNSSRAYYNEVSGSQFNLIGKNNINGEAYGYVTIPFDKTGCLLSDWSNAARIAAENSGADLNGYDHLVYAFPYVSDCNFAGWSDVGGSRVWINGGSNFKTSIVAHELGHNLNFVHASSYRCTSNGQPVAISNNCTTAEYGDLFDIMGSSSRHIHAGRKTSAGWMSPASTVEYSAAGTFSITLTPMESLNGGTKILRIPFSYEDNEVSRYYYIEFRQPYGQFDNFSPTDPVTQGVTIRVVSPPELGVETGSLLIDATPSTSTFTDASLRAGQMFLDSARGVSLTVNQVTSSAATISLTLTCIHGIPLVTPINYNNYGQSGTARDYNFRIQNADSTACGAANFSLQPNASLPSAWSQTPAVSSFQLTPGQVADISFTITSSPTAPEGLNLIGENTKNVDIPSLISTKNVFYRVDNTAPVVSLGYLPTTITQGQVVTFSAVASDNEQIDRVEFWLDASLISSCTLPSGSTTCSFSWSTVNWLGNHAILLKAFDKAGNMTVITHNIRVSSTLGGGGGKINIEQ